MKHNQALSCKRTWDQPITEISRCAYVHDNDFIHVPKQTSLLRRQPVP